VTFPMPVFVTGFNVRPSRLIDSILDAGGGNVGGPGLDCVHFCASEPVLVERAHVLIEQLFRAG
jgi:hypothetical protein